MLQIQYLGMQAFEAALRLQRELWQKRIEGEIPDQLLLLEHPHVITLGRAARAEHLLVGSEVLHAKGVQVAEADRGGDITYHGPGQLVGYPIIDLRPGRMDVLRYLRDLEGVLIQGLLRFGLTANRREAHTGVWIENRKIASIGVKISRWVTYHGFALNVNTDLSYFDLIIPCGLQKVQMTSMQKELGEKPDLRRVAQIVAAGMSVAFHTDRHEEQSIPANQKY